MKKFFIFLFMFISSPFILKGAVEVNGIFYNLDNNLKVAEVTANPSYYSGDIVIPENIDYAGNQYKVTTIGYNAFRKCSELNTIVLPNSIKTIATNAFRSCGNLKSISIPNSVTSIGDTTFVYCNSLSSIKIPGGVQKIGAYCFYGCEQLESANIGDGIIDIGNYAFSRCGNLYDIHLPNTLKSIGDHSFARCTSLNTLELPDNLEVIEQWAFSNCSTLKKVKFGRNLRIIKNSVFNYCTELQDVYFSSNIEEVGSSAFSNCRELTSVHITDLSAWCRINFGYNGNPLYYAHYLYLNNEQITDLIIPEDVIKLGSSVFEGLEGFSNINLSNVKSIGSFAFSNSLSLHKLNIPKSVIEIGEGITEGCLNLYKISVDKENNVFDSRDNSNCIIKTSGDTLIAGCSKTIIPSSVKAIGPYAFSTIYLEDIELPENLKYIGNCAFYQCYYLKNLKLPESLEYIGIAAFSGCTNIAPSLIIPNNVSYIAGRAFEFCSSLESITLPNSIQVVRNATFSGCVSLKSIEIPDNITTIESFAFSSVGATHINLGRNNKTIENGAFQDCKNLENVYCYASEIPTTDVNAFQNANMNATLHVPSNLISTYKITIPWKDFKFIEELNDGDPSPTSITYIKNRQVDQKYFDLRGRQVEKPSKGIYIKDGIKIIVK